MLEFSLDPETFRSLSQFKTEKVPVGTRPLMVFAGTALYATLAFPRTSSLTTNNTTANPP
jgi:ribosome production factor 2